MNKLHILLLYIVVTALHLVSLYWLPLSVELGSKFLLMPLLIWLVMKASAFREKKWLLAALLASWVGDMAIEWSFLAGLVIFLLAHFMYIVLFFRLIIASPQHSRYLWPAWIVVLVLIIASLSALLGKAGDMRIPITIYTVVIGNMLCLAIAGYAHWPRVAALWIVAGAASFVLSDMILGFKDIAGIVNFALGSFLVMITYAFAQFAMVKGVLDLVEHPHQP